MPTTTYIFDNANVNQSNPRRAEHFDDHFTRVPVQFTPPDNQIIGNLRGDEFGGFSYKNPHYEDSAYGSLDSTKYHLPRERNLSLQVESPQQRGGIAIPGSEDPRRSASVATERQMEAMRAKGDIFLDF